VIRLSGPLVDCFLTEHFSRPTVVGRCVHGVLSDGPRVIDDPVIVRVSPVVADLNVHGGRWVVHSVLELAKSSGFEILERRQANPAEELLDGPTTLWREVLCQLDFARTEVATRMLLAQPAAWSDLKHRASAGSISMEELRRIDTDRSLASMLALPKVAIIGAANVGKSTLANQLFGQERSITADVPGTTRDWVGEIANIDGLAVMLIDTVGRRTTVDAIEQAAIAAGNEKVMEADLVVIVLDRSAPRTEVEAKLVSDHPIAIVVANKADQPAAWDSVELDAIDTNALSGAGIDRLRTAIRNHFGAGDDRIELPRCWTARQRAIVRRSLADLSLLREI